LDSGLYPLIHREGKPCFAGSCLFQLQLVGQDFQCSSLRRKSYGSRKSRHAARDPHLVSLETGATS
jgi:hypothetical protein